ncbi:MAG: ABC transporter substrate-binding protein, partial [Firmicutes bacterium]|nr:ABC transporter substrate-binding protein [Bacillota bacterium]
SFWLCGGPAAAKTTLTFWNGFTGPDRPVLEQLVAEFNEANPDIEIKMDIQPWDTLFQKLMTAYVVGKGPDIAAFATENIPQYASAGVLAPLDDIYESGQLDPTVLVPAILENVKYEDKSYAVPMNFATLLLYYNKDHFAKAGLPTDPPKTWDEFKEYILTLTNPPERYGLAIAARETIPMWPILIWGNGGEILTRDGQVLIDSPETKEAMHFWTEIVRDKKASPIGLTGAEADKLFQTGKASMEMVGPWMTSGFTAAGLNYDVAPVPAGPKRQVTLGTSVAMVISKPAAADTQKKAAAYKFFEFWNSREAQVKWALGSGFPPTRTDLLDDPRIMEDPWVSKFAAAADQAHFYLQGTDKFRAIETDVLVPAIEAILLGRQDVDTALDDAGAQLRALIK